MTNLFFIRTIWKWRSSVAQLMAQLIWLVSRLQRSMLQMPRSFGCDNVEYELEWSSWKCPPTRPSLMWQCGRVGMEQLEWSSWNGAVGWVEMEQQWLWIACQIYIPSIFSAWTAHEQQPKHLDHSVNAAANALARASRLRNTSTDLLLPTRSFRAMKPHPAVTSADLGEFNAKTTHLK